ncbi:MAG: 30S ribosomal protein S6 [Acholeplasmatales bacterium]|nr:30S ribosomal protein S6 [Acholeplasmatales bacterium]
MKKYEIMYILRSNLDAEAVKAEVENAKNIITSNGSKVLDVNEWGFKELAYEIAGNKKGYYVVMNVEATKEAINEFNRIAGYSETIIRHIVVVDGE